MALVVLAALLMLSIARAEISSGEQVLQHDAAGDIFHYLLVVALLLQGSLL